jgi:hypothetical protein
VTSPDIVVGCPLYRREWIIEDWFRHVEMAASLAELTPVYAFIADAEDPTVPLVIKLAREAERTCVIEKTTENLARSTERVWNTERYARMVELRNTLLARVRKLAPKWFLSLDSDILLHPDAIIDMLALAGADNYDAVGSKCYLTPVGKDFPNFGFGPRGIYRYESDQQFKVDYLMAIKLLGPRAYMIDYKPDLHGEDIGYSKAAKAVGLRFGWTGACPSKHIMSPEALEQIDPRCGW